MRRFSFRLSLLALVAAFFACGEDRRIIQDAGRLLSDAGAFLADIGDRDARAQDTGGGTTCFTWEVMVQPIPARDDGQPTAPAAMPGGWEPFGVAEEPDFDKIYLRRCAG